MKEFKGTPAPWTVNPVEQFYNGSKNTFEVNHGNDGECVAEVVHGFDNAQIIAVAPELLELVIAFTNAVPNDGTWNYQACMSKANELIAKALGETPIQTP